MWAYSCFLLSLLLAYFPSESYSTCGYESCNKPKEGFINLHLVPHTHDDVGWLKTVDQYFYGSHNNIQDAGVQYILDSVVKALLENPERKFIYVETAFFWKWWEQQTVATQNQVIGLVQRGQLEFIGGSWSMPDEACTHYQSVIDDFTWGFRRLNDIFGACGRPKVGWQIDPFGHSRETAAIMARLGFDGLFLGRIDYQDKNGRLNNKTAEMIWHTSANDESNNADLFTSVMYNTYSAPSSFCYDINCHDEPIVDDVNSIQYNAPQRANVFIARMHQYATAYRTNNVLVTMGDDFMYQNAPMNFKNMDKLIKYINLKQVNGSMFNAFYSTPSCYLKAVHDSNIPLPTKQDDFFPYSSDPYAFWTGYFTSRPTLKYFERLGNNYLQVSKQLHSLSKLESTEMDNLIAMREAMAIIQHHDAITGTEQQHVANDYARILNNGFNKCNSVNQAALNKLMKKHTVDLTIESCLLRNISSCEISENSDTFIVTAYNPLSRRVDHVVRIPISSDQESYTVLCPMGHEQEVQIVKIPDSILNIPGRTSTATAELIFVAKHLPPLGFRSYYVAKSDEYVNKPKELPLDGKSVTIGYNNGASITLNGKGNVASIYASGKNVSLDQQFYYYNAAVGNNAAFINRSSGAYIFRANGTAVPIGQPQQVKVYEGPIVSEIHQTFNDWVSQVIRTYPGKDNVEYQWLVGPIPIEDAGKEVINRFTNPDIKNGGQFFTDTNGRELLRRKLNHRDTWRVRLSEKVPGNYYPITTTIAIEDENSRMSVIPDRGQGGSSLSDGQIELMVHRRLTHDDAFGVGEALNETAFGNGLVARGTHYVSFGSRAQVRLLVQEKILDSWVFLSPTNDLSFEEWANSFNMEYSALNAPLPDNIQILTLEPWIGKSYLLRLEHIMEYGDDPELSRAVIINIQDIFSDIKISSISETTLGANQKASESTRLIWKTEDGDSQKVSSTVDDSPNVTLTPMQIRTFIVSYN